MALKVTKAEMLNVMIDYGLSIIECERAFDSKEEFAQAIENIIDNNK